MLSIGLFFKVRPHDYHRRKEWALLVGPKVYVPIRSGFSSSLGRTSLVDQVEAINPFQVVLHTSVQVRRPFGKKSWFIHPGLEVALLPIFSGLQSDVGLFHLFLNVGYAFWEKRG